MCKIEVGSMVKVVEPGFIYASYTEFANEAGYPDAVVDTVFVEETEKLQLDIGTVGKVVYMAPHKYDGGTGHSIICVIEGEFGHRLFSKIGLVLAEI